MSRPRPIVPALLLVVLLALPSTLAQETPRPSCEPGTGPSVDREDVLALVRGGHPVQVPAGATVLASLDRGTLCPDLPEGIPCVVPGPVQLACARVAGDVDLAGIVVRGDLVLDGAQVDGSLRLAGVQVLGSIRFAGAEISGSVDLDDVLASGGITGDDAGVREGLSFRRLRVVGDFSVSGAETGGPLALADSLVTGEADLSLDRGPSIRVTDAAVLADLVLESTRIDGDVHLERIGVGGSIDTDELDVRGEIAVLGARVGEDVSFTGQVRGGVRLADTSLGGDLEFMEATVKEPVDVSDARIEGEIYLDEARLARGLRVSDSSIEEGVDLGESRIGGEVVFTGTRFGAPVDASGAKLDAAPRAVACTPPDPLAADSGGD